MLSMSGPDHSKIGTDFSVTLGVLMEPVGKKVAVCAPQAHGWSKLSVAWPRLLSVFARLVRLLWPSVGYMCDFVVRVLSRIPSQCHLIVGKLAHSSCVWAHAWLASMRCLGWAQQFLGLLVAPGPHSEIGF